MPAFRKKTFPSSGLVPNILVGLLFLYSAGTLWMALSGHMVHSNDFRHLWGGARILELGRDPYNAQELRHFAAAQGWPAINPFVYLPTTGLMLMPLASLPFSSAVKVWFWANWLGAWGLVLFGPTLLRVGRPGLARLAGAAFLASAMPFFRQMTAGQMNVVTAWIVLGGAATLLRKRETWTGSLLALGFAWKLAPALVIAALAPLGRWKAFATGIGLSIVLWGITIPWTGFAIQSEAVATIAQMGYGRSTWSAEGEDFYRQPFNQSPNSLLHHLLTLNPYAKPWHPFSPKIADRATIAFSLMLIGLWLARWQTMKKKFPEGSGTETTLYLAASLAMLLLPSLLWDHYAVQALPVLLWLAGDPRTARDWKRAIGFLSIMVLLCVPWAHESAINQSGLGILLMSLRLWPLLALYGWLLFDAPALPKTIVRSSDFSLHKAGTK